MSRMLNRRHCRIQAAGTGRGRCPVTTFTGGMAGPTLFKCRYRFREVGQTDRHGQLESVDFRLTPTQTFGRWPCEHFIG